MAVWHWILPGILLVLVTSGVSSQKRDVSWFGQSRTSKIQSPNLEQIHIQHPQHQDATKSFKDSSKKLKTITDVIDETLANKQHQHHDTIAAEAKKAGLKYHPLGCFLDNKAHQALPDLLSDLQGSIDWNNLHKTIRVCAMDAHKEGFKVFAIQKFGLCYSGKDALFTYSKYGKSDDCTKGVGRFGSNFVYAFDEPPIPMKRPTWHCFPGDSQVQTDKHTTAMSTLRIGDRIKTLDRQGSPIYSEVLAFLHRQETSVADYLSIKTDNGRSLRVSKKHLVFKIDSTTSNTIAVYASDLKIGDALQTVGQSAETGRIVNITIATQGGVYAPLTRHGTMVVDGILVSCYAHWDSHTVAHISMAPLRLWKDLTSFATSLAKFLGFQGNHYGGSHDGIHWYALSLMNIVQKFVPLQ